MPVYTLNVVGESFRNPDGKHRQRIIAMCQAGDELELRREPNNSYSPYAVAVVHDFGQVGYIAESQAKWVSEIIDDSRPIAAHIHAIFGGGGFLFWKRHLGVLLALRTGKDARSQF